MNADELIRRLVDDEREPVVFWMEQHGATVEVWSGTGFGYRCCFKGDTIAEAAQQALEDAAS